MKSFVLLLLPLLVSSAAIEKPKALKERQLDSLLGLVGGLLQGPKKPLSTKKLTVVSPWTYDNTVREQVLWGPFKLNPVNGSHSNGPMKLDANSDVFTSMITGICSDCTVLSADARMVMQDGSSADISKGVYGHHIITADVGRMQIMPPAMSPCTNGSAPGLGGLGGLGGGMGAMGGMMGGMDHSGKKRQISPGMSVFVGKGGEDSRFMFAAPNSTFKSGFYIQKNDQMLFTAEQVNYDNVPKDLYFSLDYEYVPGRPEGLLDVGMGAIDVQGCRNLALPNPPTDRMYTYSSAKWNVIANGYLLNLGPHLHDGALNIKFFHNDKLACQSDVIYGSEDEGAKIDGQEWETIKSYSICPDPIQIKVGDTISMTSDYDLSKHRLRPNAMNHDMGAEAMALTNFIFAADLKK